MKTNENECTIVITLPLLFVTDGWDAPQPNAPMVHHAGAPGMFWFAHHAREANSALRSAAKAVDEHKLGNVHGA